MDVPDTTIRERKGHHGMLHDGAILLVEDNPNDIELTLNAFDRHHLANHVAVVRDGE